MTFFVFVAYAFTSFNNFHIMNIIEPIHRMIHFPFLRIFAMRRIPFPRKNSLLFRWLIIVIIAVLPFQTLSLYINISNTHAVRQETQQTAVANVNYLCNSIDDSIQLTHSQMDQLLANMDIQSLYTLNSYMTNSEYYMKVRDVLNLLTYVSRSSRFISDITLFYPVINQYLSTSIPHTRILPNEKIAERIDIYSHCKNILAEENGRFWLGRSDLSTINKETGLPLYYIEITVNTEAIGDLLSSFNQYSASNAIMLCSTNGAMLKSRGCIPFSSEDEAQLRKILTDAGNDVTSAEIEVSQKSYTVFYRMSPQTKCIFCQLVSNERLYGIINRMNLFTTILIVGELLLLIICIRVVHHDIYLPITNLKSAFVRIGQGQFQTDLKPEYTDEFNQLIIQTNRMAEKLYDLVEHDYVQQMLIQRAEFKHLQAQISPHFLYNSFYFLENMIDMEDLDSARAFLIHLSAYYEYLTKTEKDTVQLQEEYAHALDYLAIQNMRFGSNLKTVTSQLPESWSTVMVPRLILQPFLENSLTYSRQSDRPSTIRITFSEEADCLIVTIEDSGNHLTDETIEKIRMIIHSAESMGALSNIGKRLSIYYGNTDCVRAERSDLGGLKIELRLERRSSHESA